MSKPREDPQQAFDETAILDKELENHCGDYFELIEQHRGWIKSRAAIKVAMENRPEGRYRVGAFVLEVTERSGGGISIPNWRSKIVSISAE